MSVAGQFSVHLYTVVAASNLVKTSAQIAQDELDLDTPFKVNRALQTANCKPQTTSLKSQTANRQIAIVTTAPQPNTLNSVLFLVAMSIQNITFAMNYQVCDI